MFERYTERARRILFFARYEASQLGSPSIEAEHLLLGLLREGKGPAAKILARADFSYANFQQMMAQRAPAEAKPTSVEIPFSATTKLVLKRAAEEADALGHHSIGTGHLLLAFLAGRDAGAIAGLEGLTLDQARQDVAQLHEEQAPTPRGPSALPNEYREVSARIFTAARNEGQPHAHKPDLPPSHTVHIAPSLEPAGTRSTAGPSYWAVYGFTLRAALARVYAIGESCVELPAAINAQARYDIVVVLPNVESPGIIDRLVQQGIEQHFGFTLRLEPRPLDVYLLSADPSQRRGTLLAGVGAFGAVDLVRGTANELALIHQFMEIIKARPFIVAGANENLYVRKVEDLPESMLVQLREQFGIIATPARREGLILIATTQ